MTNSEVPARVKGGITLAAIVSLAGLAFYGRFESAYQSQNDDPYKVAAQFSRFADFRAAVPENAILGYVTDAAAGSLAWDALLNTAQYALAPRVLDKDHPRDLVLGNFTKPGMESRPGLHVERDFGNGVVLYRRDR